MYTLLIADDERTIREGIAASIDWESLGVSRVLLAPNGKKACAMIAAEKPAIAIVDIVMPEMTGIELITQCRREGACPEFVIISGHDDFSYAQEALRHHVHNYILKPCDTAEIADTIRGIIGELERRRSLEADHREMQERLDTLMPQARANLFRDFIAGSPVNPGRLKLLRESFDPHGARFQLLILRALDPQVHDTLHLMKQYMDTHTDSPPCLQRAENGDSLVMLFNPADRRAVDAMVERLRGEMTGGSERTGFVAAVSAPGPFEALPALSIAAQQVINRTLLTNGAAMHASVIEVAAGSYSAITQKAMQYIEEHFPDRSLSLGEISKEALHLNADYVGKLFKKECGLTFSEYLMAVRMEQAKRIIANTDDMRMYEVALQVGFGNDAAYFSRAFHKYAGVTPGEYRKKHSM